MPTIVACVVVLALAGGAAAAQSRDLSIGVFASDGQLKSFYLAIGDHYGVPPERVATLRDRYRCRDEELPVAFFLAARARVAAADVLNLRLQGRSWLDITYHYGLAPDIYFVPVQTDPTGPPYGRAYGHYRTRGAGREWARSALADPDIVALTNLRFLSEHHGVSAETLIATGGWQVNFVAINDELTKGRAGGATQQARGNRKKK